MHGQAPTISTKELYVQVGTATAPIVIDARKRDAFDADDRLIVGAARYDIDTNKRWSKNLPAGRAVILYCAHGAELSVEFFC